MANQEITNADAGANIEQQQAWEAEPEWIKREWPRIETAIHTANMMETLGWSDSEQGSALWLAVCCAMEGAGLVIENYHSQHAIVFLAGAFWVKNGGSLVADAERLTETLDLDPEHAELVKVRTDFRDKLDDLDQKQIAKGLRIAKEETGDPIWRSSIEGLKLTSSLAAGLKDAGLSFSGDKRSLEDAISIFVAGQRQGVLLAQVGMGAAAPEPSAAQP